MQPKLLIFFFICLVSLSLFVFWIFVEDPNLDDPALKTLIEQLEDEGYEVLSIENTMLGRYHIEAHSDEFEREIVLAPGGGTVLRDHLSPLTEDSVDGDD
jgi:hypothetical protein